MKRARAGLSRVKPLEDILAALGLRRSAWSALAVQPLSEPTAAARIAGSCARPALHHSTLPNGVRVVSEEPRLPGPATLGVIADYGTRDETAESSGVLHAMSLTRYKSMLNTVDTVNYGMVQMSGGEYRMGFDREKTWYKVQCLPHDAVDLFGMMVDCAFEPRNHVTCNAAIGKLAHSHRYLAAAQAHHALTDLALAAVYGPQGLGNPLLGREDNASRLNPQTVQAFQLAQTAPSGITVVGLGVESHAELEELAAAKLGHFGGQRERVRAAPAFAPCHLLVPKRASHTDLLLLFPASAWDSADLHLHHILAAALGRADPALRDAAGLSQSRGVLARQLFHRHALFRSLEAFNMHFTDAGLFGLRAAVTAGREVEALELLAGALTGVDEAAFHAAKELVAREALTALGDDFTRVEEYLKEACVFGRVTAPDLLQRVRGATFADFTAFLARLRAAPPALVAQGPDLGHLPSQERLRGLFS